MSDYPAIAVQGPTGSGKSLLGMGLAARFHGEIVSCDAFQVYRRMDIGTAKASGEDQKTIRHHLLDLFDPCRDFSAGDYQFLAREALNEIRARNHLPLVVGGNGFYLRALIEGLFTGPGRNEELRSRLRRNADRHGASWLHRILLRIDRTSASRINEADSSRLIRALEVYFHTGKPISWWQSCPRDALKGFRWLKIGIAWPREELYRRIDDRVDGMLRAGFAEEVHRLRTLFPENCQAFKAIGYKQLAEYWSGSKPLADAVAEIKRESRRYAKRQLTWFRADPTIIWLDGTNWQALIAEAECRVESFLSAP